jgi:signal transduction histidine kinase
MKRGRYELVGKALHRRGAENAETAQREKPLRSLSLHCVSTVKAFFFLLFSLSLAQAFVLAQPIPDSYEPPLARKQSREQLRNYVEYLKGQAAADPANHRLQLDLARNYYALAVEHDTAALAEAEKILNRLLAAEPHNAVALAYRGSLLGLKLGFSLVAREDAYLISQQHFADLDRAVALAPDNQEVRRMRAYSSLYTPSFAGRDQVAVDDFSQLIRLLEAQPDTVPERAELLLTLGDAYHKKGEPEQARVSWQRAATLRPSSATATAAELRLKNLAQTATQPDFRLQEVAAFFGFLIGVVIFAILVVLLARDVKAARKQRGGMWAALIVAAAALGWNGLQFVAVVSHALGSAWLAEWQRWQQSELRLALALSPILLGLATAYRFYQATFMDIVLKRGLSLLALFALSLLYGKLIEYPSSLIYTRVSNETLRNVFFTMSWLWLYAAYPLLRDQIYKLVDRYLFKRRDYSRLLDWFAERLRGAQDETSLLAAACAAVQEAFAAEPVRLVPASDELAKGLAEALRANVLLRRQLNDEKLEAELATQGVELLLVIRAGTELAGLILIGRRAYGQSYLSEELSVLRALAAELGRTLENLRLNEAQRQQAIAEEELRKLVAQSELMALRAQINPHFFFNALNSVAALIAEDPPRAEALLENLAELFRHAFRPSAEIIPLWQELELVETYLEVEQVRLGDKLQFRKAVLPDTLPVRIPALTIQPLVENAIQHGIGKLSGGGAVTLSASLRYGRLHIIVADTGVGIAATEMNDLLTRGVGLSNVNSRLLKLYGAQARLRIDSAPRQGTTVSFAVPVTEAEAVAEPIESISEALPAR